MKVFAAALLLATATAPAAQAADLATLTLRGIVNVVNNIEVKPNGANLLLNITGGESNKLVAAVEETSNNLTGYKINVKSANQSELRNTSDATRKTTYKLGYNGQTPITLSQNYQQVKNVSSLNSLTTASSNVVVNVDALPGALAGTYEDTVTFQIVANN